MRRAASIGAGVVVLLFVLGAVFVIVLVVRGIRKDSPGAGDRASPAFVDIASAAGLRRPNVSGSDERLFIFENIGSGGALLDSDGDGLLDALVINAGPVEIVERKGGGLRPRLLPGPGCSLYRQSSPGTFEEVSESAGMRFDGWGVGAAVGDVDNDGDLDVLITAFGPNRFYLNRGDGTFIERAREAGLDHPGFSTSAAFLDHDGDGLLDLYVANYVEFDLERPPNDGLPCREHGVAISCGPPMHDPARDVLYRNLGDGRFEDITESAGLGAQPGAYGLGVAAGDFDRDGRPDIYVANDTTANFLWMNRGDGTFADEALFRGAALSENAQGQAGMGVAVGDVNGDGWLDILVTNYQDEPNAYYESLGDGTFADRSAASGLGPASRPYLGWGAAFLDVTLDGRLDVVVVNGHVHPRAAELGAGASFEQPGLLFESLGGGSYRPAASSGDLARPRNHRGLAAGDIDGDGDQDLLVTLLDGPPLLLENRAGAGKVIGLVLRGSVSNREGIGARIEIDAGGRLIAREVSRSGSYLSAHDAAVLVGLGDATRADRVRIAWPSGRRGEAGPLEAGSVWAAEEANGSVRRVRRLGPR